MFVLTLLFDQESACSIHHQLRQRALGIARVALVNCQNLSLHLIACDAFAHQQGMLYTTYLVLDSLAPTLLVFLNVGFYEKIDFLGKYDGTLSGFRVLFAFADFECRPPLFGCASHGRRVVDELLPRTFPRSLVRTFYLAFCCAALRCMFHFLEILIEKGL